MALLFRAPVSQDCCGDSAEYVKWLAHSKDVASEGWLCYSDFFTPISTETGFRSKTGLGQQGGGFPRTCSGSAEDGEVSQGESARNPPGSAYYLLCEEQRLRLKRQCTWD